MHMQEPAAATGIQQQPTASRLPSWHPLPHHQQRLHLPCGSSQLGGSSRGARACCESHRGSRGSRCCRHRFQLAGEPAPRGPRLRPERLWQPPGPAGAPLAAAALCICSTGAAAPPLLLQINSHLLWCTCRLAGPQMSLSGERYEQCALPLDLGRQLWRQHDRWDAAGWSRLSLAQQVDGTWLAGRLSAALRPSRACVLRHNVPK